VVPLPELVRAALAGGQEPAAGSGAKEMISWAGVFGMTGRKYGLLDAL
jgi:hypothetical protein